MEKLKHEYENITLIANSIGAFFSMNAGIRIDFGEDLSWRTANTGSIRTSRCIFWTIGSESADDHKKRLAETERLFVLKQLKKKEKHRGH